MADLPSVNSTTSLSDNVALRNYYDKLLFKNNSGKSLTDLPKRVDAHKLNTSSYSDINNPTSNSKSDQLTMDFINGFNNPAYGTNNLARVNAQEVESTSTSQGSIFQFSSSLPGGQQYDSVGLHPFSFGLQASNSRHSSIASDRSHNSNIISSPNNYYAALTQSLSPTSTLSPINNAGAQLISGFPQENFTCTARRSSYISDTLIHSHDPVSESFYPNVVSMNYQQPKLIPMSAPHQRVSLSSSQISQQQALPQPRNRYLHSQKHTSIPHVSLNTTVQPSILGPSDTSNDGTYLLDNGLILINGQIISSSDLRKLYKDCGKNYFASGECFNFIDRIKLMLQGKEATLQSEKVMKFLGFLKSCNLNYNPQSDAFVSSAQHRRSSTSSYLHYKPLVLVALKNGKLELLSLSQSTNLNMGREDLVVIDGDRGKDLALVVESNVDIDLALFINFLKKKIHFDSLIANISQHYPNDKFIKALMDSTNCNKDELNPKLYDVIELTQLIIPSKQVLRFATPWEVSTNLHNKFQDELKALHIAQMKLKSLNSGLSTHHQPVLNSTTNVSEGQSLNPPNNRSQLNIKILNAEFQCDRKKLTFYYVCQERNDFRELIKELFKFYKTRIWLCAIPNNLAIDTKYYDVERKEWEMYQEMMKHYTNEDLIDCNLHSQQGGFIIAPPLNKIELDNFQIGVYKELVNAMFS